MPTQNSVGNGLTGATGSGSFVGSTGPTFDTIISIPNDPGAFPAASIVAGANVSVVASVRLISSGNNTNQNNGSGSGHHMGTGVLGTNYQDGYIWQRYSGSGNGGSCRFTKGRGTSANPIVYDDAIRIENGDGVGLITIGGTSFTNFKCDILGSVLGSNGPAGMVAQVLSATLAVGSATSLTTATPQTITSVSLTAGDWDIWGNIGFIAASGTLITGIVGSISDTNNTHATSPNGGAYCEKNVAFPASVTQIIPIGCRRVNISSTTTYYLVGTATFTVSTCTAYGSICARRRR